ncbi:ATP-binding protein [Spirillospora sp. CA-255316]
MSSPPCPEPTAFRLRLHAGPTAVGRGRSLIRRQLDHWNLAHVRDDAELIGSELLTNAIEALRALDVSRLGGPGSLPATVVLGLKLLPQSLFIEVGDSAAAAPTVRAPDELSEGGRGLLIVACLARSWGSRPSANGGKIVWAEIETARP